MTSHELARLLLAAPDEEISVNVAAKYYPVDDALPDDDGLTIVASHWPTR